MTTTEMRPGETGGFPAGDDCLAGRSGSRGNVLLAKVAVPKFRGLRRPRLCDQLDQVWSGRLGLVLAPAGSGKTTLLAQWADRTDVPVAWYHAEAGDSTAHAFVAHLERALVPLLGVDGGWESVDDALVALETWADRRALIVVDDLHVLKGTDAESSLERLIEYLPAGLRLVAASPRDAES